MFKSFFSITYTNVSKYEFIMANIMTNDSDAEKNLTP